MLCSLTMKALWPDKREDSEGAVPGEPNWPTIKINIGSNNGGGPLQYAAPILINFHLGPPLRTPVIVTHARAVVLIWIAATFPPIQTRRPKRRSASHYELSKSVIPPASLVHLVLGARGVEGWGEGGAPFTSWAIWLKDEGVQILLQIDFLFQAGLGH